MILPFIYRINTSIPVREEMAKEYVCVISEKDEYGFGIDNLIG
jgi:hypothetical protein